MAKSIRVVYNNPHNITHNIVQNFVNHGANNNAQNNDPSFTHKVAICNMLTKHVNYQKELLKDFQTMFSQTWRRPKEVALPVVWCRFGRTNKNGKEFKFSIQTATDEHHDEMLDIMVKHFLTEATFKATAGCHKSPQYIKTIKGLIRSVVFPQNVSLVCILEEEFFANGSGKGRTVGQVVGYNMCAVCREGEDLDFTEIMKTEAGEKTIKIYKEVGNRLPSVHEKYCVREYLGSMGLCVVPDYRGMALAQEMLLSRISLCKEIGVKVTSALFTTKASILGAMDAGFAEDGSVAYADLEKTLGFKFIANCDSCKLLSYQIKQ